jgi:predicted nucleotidyltransferase
MKAISEKQNLHVTKARVGTTRATRHRNPAFGIPAKLPRVKRARRSQPRQLVAPVAVDLIPRERIQHYCEAVGQKFVPERIILFGSYAYGSPTADSDVDLLVIMPFRGNDVSKAIEIRAAFDTPFPLDLLVRKPQFIEARLRERDMFIEMVVRQGVVLYENKHA